MNLKSYRILCKKWAIMRGMYDSHDKDNWRFSRDSSIYWFSVYWHNGQNSNLYRIQCKRNHNYVFICQYVNDTEHTIL